MDSLVCRTIVNRKGGYETLQKSIEMCSCSKFFGDIEQNDESKCRIQINSLNPKVVII